MADITLLVKTIDENIAILFPPKDPILQIDTSIVSTGVSIQDEKTLNLRVCINSRQKNNEYASLGDYWADIKPVLQQDIHPGLKAKKMFEMRTAVTSNDRTIVNGCETPPRAAVLDSLKSLIDHYTSIPAEKPTIKQYLGRTDPLANDFDHRMENEMKFLRQNRDALNAMIFHNPEELKRIRAHSHKFAEEIMYRTELRGITDE
jgi:hypothetical protein